MSTIKPSILIYGAPNSGKTSSLMSLSHDAEAGSKVLYINGDNKALPWFGKNHFGRFTLQCPTQLPSVIDSAGNSEKFDTIIVDTVTQVLSTFQGRFVGSAEPKAHPETDHNYVAVTKSGQVEGRKAWGRYGTLINDILDAGDQTNAQMIFFTHMSLVKNDKNDYVYEAPLAGAVGKIGLLGRFTVSFVSQYISMEVLKQEPDSPFLTKEPTIENGTGRYVFQVAKTPETEDYPIRTMVGMFPQGVTYIDADIKKLVEYLDERLGSDDAEVTF